MKSLMRVEKKEERWRGVYLKHIRVSSTTSERKEKQLHRCHVCCCCAYRASSPPSLSPRTATVKQVEQNDALQCFSRPPASNTHFNANTHTHLLIKQTATLYIRVTACGLTHANTQIKTHTLLSVIIILTE